MDVLGLAETRLIGQGQRDIGEGQVLLLSGSDSIRARGVGVWLSKRMASVLLGFNPVSDRIVTARFDTKSFKLTIIQVYAPTNQASDSDKDWFYEQLQESRTRQLER